MQVIFAVGQLHAAQNVLLIQSSSAMSKVFFPFNAAFNQQQGNCLQDYFEAFIMLQYNDR